MFEQGSSGWGEAPLALGVVVTVAIVLLIIQNGRSAHLSWLAFHFSSPLWVTLLLTAAAAAVVWSAIHLL